MKPILYSYYRLEIADYKFKEAELPRAEQAYLELIRQLVAEYEIADYEFKAQLFQEEQAYFEVITQLAEYEAANGREEEPL